MLPIASRRQAAALLSRRSRCLQVASCRSRSRSRCSSRRHAASIATTVFPGQATPEGTARFLAEHPQNQGVSSDKDRLLTLVNPKTRLEVNVSHQDGTLVMYRKDSDPTYTPNPNRHLRAGCQGFPTC